MNKRILILLSILLVAIVATVFVYVDKMFPAVKKNLVPVQKLVNSENQSKVLIVYYSYTGNTKKIANKIHNLVGGDIIELETKIPYTVNYRAVVTLAKDEVDKKYKPELKTKIDNISQYDKIVLGTPVWWYTMAPPVRTFLNEYNFDGKEIIPFYTHGGSGSANSNSEIAKICPKAKLGSELSVFHKDLDSSDSEIERWAKKNKLIK